MITQFIKHMSLLIAAGLALHATPLAAGVQIAEISDSLIVTLDYEKGTPTKNILRDLVEAIKLLRGKQPEIGYFDKHRHPQKSVGLSLFLKIGQNPTRIPRDQAFK